MLDKKGQRNATSVRQNTTNTQLSESLIEAAQLLSRVKQIIFTYNKENKNMHDRIFPDVFEIEDCINTVSSHIGNIAGYEFQEKYFYNQEGGLV